MSEWQLLQDVPDYGIRLDKHGRFWHEGQPVENEKVHLIFAQNLRRLADGGYALVIGFDRCRIEVEDVPYVAHRVQLELAEGGGLDKVILALSDGSAETLDPATLTISEENVLYCRVKGGDHRARFDRTPYMALAEQMEEVGEAFALPIGGQRYIVGAE